MKMVRLQCPPSLQANVLSEALMEAGAMYVSVSDGNEGTEDEQPIFARHSPGTDGQPAELESWDELLEARALWSNRALTRLDLSGCEFTDPDASVAAILGSCTALTHLNLSGVYVTSAAFGQLACTSLEHVTLRDTQIEYNAALALLFACPRLGTMDISETSIDDESPRRSAEPSAPSGIPAQFARSGLRLRAGRSFSKRTWAVHHLRSVSSARYQKAPSHTRCCGTSRSTSGAACVTVVGLAARALGVLSGGTANDCASAALAARVIRRSMVATLRV